MKLNVGDYVRTRWGCIARFKGIYEGFYEFDNIIMDESSAVREELFVDIVEKTSPDIIDLIQVGDVVHSKYDNEWWTIQEHQGKNEPLWLQTEWQVIESEEDFFEQIDGIVTKEQMEQMEYKVED